MVFRSLCLVLALAVCSTLADNVVELTDANFDSELENMGTALGNKDGWGAVRY